MAPIVFHTDHAWKKIAPNSLLFQNEICHLWLLQRACKLRNRRTQWHAAWRRACAAEINIKLSLSLLPWIVFFPGYLNCMHDSHHISVGFGQRKQIQLFPLLIALQRILVAGYRWQIQRICLVEDRFYLCWPTQVRCYFSYKWSTVTVKGSSLATSFFTGRLTKENPTNLSYFSFSPQCLLSPDTERPQSCWRHMLNATCCFHLEVLGECLKKENWK